jgi:hypothetical protein
MWSQGIVSISKKVKIFIYLSELTKLYKYYHIKCSIHISIQEK